MPVNQNNLTALQSIESQIQQRLVDITAQPKPSYTEDGRTFSWTEYQQMLLSQLTTIKNLIGRENSAAVPAKSVRYHERWKRGLERSPIVGILNRDENTRL